MDHRVAANTSAKASSTGNFRGKKKSTKIRSGMIDHLCKRRSRLQARFYIYFISYLPGEEKD
ncbi:hypothetical protein Ciccas_013734 [Cichlidogyrus casuarinus]|uniref:Uncharacterized protein n=1 Tax=Cichlidogyrus casuarinus TaxID=1844966 RepID=A0ABD2PJU4_9PLAT